MTVTEESWDEATPVQPAPRTGFELTSDPETYIISCCLLDEGKSFDLAMEAGLIARDFKDRRHQVIYGVLKELEDAKVPFALDTLVPQLNGRLDEAGGIEYLLSLTDPLKIGTTARAGHHINELAAASRKAREIQRLQAEIRKVEKDGVESAKKVTIPQRPPSSFVLAEDNDASVLLGNRFLNRGDGGILVGSSGMGKSSASIQMAVGWALGLPFQGIKSNGCLKVLIVQSEDSDGDIAEVMLSMRHMLHLTPEQITQVDERVRIVCDRVNRGDAFIMALRGHVKEFSPDLVIINPLQAFIDGDVTESRDLGKFLRGGLNGLNDNKFGYLLVHHTTKPATGPQRSERQWHEVMYDMAGGAELINWARFVISLRAAKTNTPGDFDLVLAKRGRRANVTGITGEAPFIKEEIITSIPVRHSTGSIEVPGRRRPVSIIFWEPRILTEDEKPTKQAPGGRPEKYPFANWSSVFPAKNTAGLPIAQLLNQLRPNGAIGEKSIHGVLARWLDKDQAIEFTHDKNGVKLWRKSV